MLSTEQATHVLADRIQCPEGTTTQRRQALEASLLPMVRCALRMGRGHPRLLQWVRRALPTVVGTSVADRVDPDRTAGAMTRLLCSALVQQARGRPDGGTGLMLETMAVA